MGLKVFFLEIVHPDLDSGKVWGFSIFSFCTPPSEISGLPLLWFVDPELKTGHKTKYVHADHLIRAHNKVPNETKELDVPVPDLELCEQSYLGTDDSKVSTSLPQPVNFLDEDKEPNHV